MHQITVSNFWSMQDVKFISLNCSSSEFLVIICPSVMKK
uniref:Uncharacterized protein n=1 Tax=Arundo donax TaxID=35708 RepID=A0A0A8YN99_ARUDO